MKCPKCGSTKIRLVRYERKLTWLWLIIFWAVYPFWLLIKGTIALMVLAYYDWWMYLIKKHQGKGYIWLSKRMIQNNRKIFFCNNCGKTFRG